MSDLWTDEQLLAQAQTIIVGQYGTAAVYGVLKLMRNDYEARIVELEAELTKAKKPLLTVDEVNSLEKLVGDSDIRDEINAMWKLRSQHCTYEGHHDCHGELWQCAECGDIHCCIEGGDTDVELCDSCWAEKHKEGADHE